jgi:hypothetical protein
LRNAGANSFISLVRGQPLRQTAVEAENPKENMLRFNFKPAELTGLVAAEKDNLACFFPNIFRTLTD